MIRTRQYRLFIVRAIENARRYAKRGAARVPSSELYAPPYQIFRKIGRTAPLPFSPPFPRPLHSPREYLWGVRARVRVCARVIAAHIPRGCTRGVGR